MGEEASNTQTAKGATAPCLGEKGAAAGEPWAHSRRKLVSYGVVARALDFKVVVHSITPPQPSTRAPESFTRTGDARPFTTSLSKL